jgi:hypothetical protein
MTENCYVTFRFEKTGKIISEIKRSARPAIAKRKFRKPRELGSNKESREHYPGLSYLIHIYFKTLLEECKSHTIHGRLNPVGP